MHTNQFYKGIVGSSIAVWLGAWGALSQSAQAVQLADGTVAFVQPPQLLKVTTPYKGIRVLGVNYYFTLSVPENAGEPLQRVAIAQQEAPDTVRFSLDKTGAFVDQDRDAKVALGETTQDKETQAVSVTFDPPISPGKTVTISLRASRNPDIPGTYLFGVTAFPQGEKVQGQFLGFGRLQFYGGGDGFSSFWDWR